MMRTADVENTTMKIPRFELTRVYEDGTQEPPQIVPVMQLPWDMRTDRRGFLGAALMAGAARPVNTGAREKDAPALPGKAKRYGRGWSRLSISRKVGGERL
jgi:hypothetical protein